MSSRIKQKQALIYDVQQRASMSHQPGSRHWPPRETDSRAGCQWLDGDHEYTRDRVLALTVIARAKLDQGHTDQAIATGCEALHILKQIDSPRVADEPQLVPESPPDGLPRQRLPRTDLRGRQAAFPARSFRACELAHPELG